MEACDYIVIQSRFFNFTFRQNLSRLAIRRGVMTRSRFGDLLLDV